MKNMKYSWLLYFIVFVITTTIIIQLYWNYKNYLINKQQLTNDVQQCTDGAIETYFANLAEKSTIAYAIESESTDSLFDNSKEIDSILKTIRLKAHKTINIDSIPGEFTENVSIFKSKSVDSLFGILHNGYSDSTQLTTRKFSVKDSGSIFNYKDFRRLTTKVIISMTNDNIQLNTIDSLFNKALLRKQIDLDYGITLESPFKKIQKLKPENINSSSLNVISSSNYLPQDTKLKVYFNNITKTILKRSLFGILISTLLVLAIVSCLFFLLTIIKHQKQLAEVKNDLISNITHEFKTPIATIGVALESINNFNVINDKAKTKTYLDMSSNQLNKLNIMVEKLLETATLDSDTLELKKENLNLANLLDTLLTRYKMQHQDKAFILSNYSEIQNIYADAFHIENALNNILDNAVKYGGNSIEIYLTQDKANLNISILDNGNNLKKANKDKIFEKFYRVPKGNTHDIKGFGIGLYYTKTIIEKHNGSIKVDLSNHKTTFKIVLPNG